MTATVNTATPKQGRQPVMVWMKWFLALVVALIAVGTLAAQANAETHYYAAEADSVICGFVEVETKHEVLDGKKALTIKESVLVKLTALGAQVETRATSLCHVDTETGRYTYFESDIDQGTIRLKPIVKVKGDVASVTLEPDGTAKEVALPPDAVLENPVFFPHLVKDFVKSELTEKTYLVLDPLDAELQQTRYTKKGVETLSLAGKTYQALVLDEVNLKTGDKATWWFSVKDGLLLKMKMLTRTLFLADKSAKEKIRAVNVDNLLFAKANVAISDVKNISYLRVKATMEPVGYWITTESLNVRGQKFEGTVNENHVEGVFEISHAKYDGKGAPAFPPSLDTESLKRYLKPEDMVESSDPALVKKAQEITEGSKDSWEAAKRLSKWVAEEITYDIPGGGSARNTYASRAGECGGHSRLLAAFCRAVGIPARVIWGCVYVPNFGGSFGQHGWNEIYMGEAGWIQVDATMDEIDYVDSGHIRLGELLSMNTRFNAPEMEILDFQAGSQKMGAEVVAEEPGEYEPYLGNYRGPLGNLFKVLVQNGRLAVDIPGQMVVELKDADDSGRRGLVVSDQVSFSFEEDDAGKVTELVLYQDVRLPRKPDSGPDSTDAPAELRKYLGKYPVPMQKMDLTVIYRDGGLVVDDPNEGLVRLKETGEEGVWIDEFDKNTISFAVDDSGDVVAMVVHVVQRFPRVDTE